MLQVKMVLKCLALVTIASAAHAKSGLPMIKSTQLQIKVCGTETKNCRDSIVFKKTEYDIKFDVFDPTESEQLNNDTQSALEQQRSKRTKYVGPMTALFAISKEKNTNTGRKTLFILDNTLVEFILR